MLEMSLAGLRIKKQLIAQKYTNMILRHGILTTANSSQLPVIKLGSLPIGVVRPLSPLPIGGRGVFFLDSINIFHFTLSRPCSLIFFRQSCR